MITKQLTPCSLAQIAASGQCFRLTECTDNWWRVCAGAQCVRVRQQDDRLTFTCGEDEFTSYWRHYFDWDTDYTAFLAAVSAEDAFLTQAAAYGHGLRILRQELWETLITFLISQNNNIPRIRAAVEALCTRWGTQKTDAAGAPYYTFPEKDALAQASMPELRAAGLGYRDKYIHAICQSSFDPAVIAALPPAQAQAQLLTLPGVGPKVASCIGLFGLHDLSAFPVDTWMRKVCDAHYPGGFPLARYAGFAGVIQQYMFFYGRAQTGK